MPTGTGLHLFQAEFPDRFIDVGIAEQHAVALSAGMALAGERPVVGSAQAAFCPAGLSSHAW